MVLRRAASTAACLLVHRVSAFVPPGGGRFSPQVTERLEPLTCVFGNVLVCSRAFWGAMIDERTTAATAEDTTITQYIVMKHVG